jgi:hypothetical protein
MFDWQRIESLGTLCGLCHKPDWCLQSGGAIICARTQRCNLDTCRFCRSGRSRRAGEGGWLHLTARPSRQQRSRSKRHRVVDQNFFEQLHRIFLSDIQAGQYDWWAQQLGVTAYALRRLEMGWSNCPPVGVTFPLRSPTGNICGISVRSIDGSKRCIPGSALGSGLFVPEGLNAQRVLFLPEGASDTAALISVGLQAAGRPSTSTRPELVRRFVMRHGFRRVVVVADRDAHGAGQSAATTLAQYFKHFVRCDLLLPPVKDVRQWIRQGADRNQVLKGIECVD